MNSLALLEDGCTPFLSLHLEMFRIRRRAHFIPFHARPVKHAPEGHDSTIGIVYPGSGPALCTVRMTTLPLVTLDWTSKDSIAVAGHDRQPYVFSENESGWRLIGSLDNMSAPKSVLTPPPPVQSGWTRKVEQRGLQHVEERGFRGSLEPRWWGWKLSRKIRVVCGPPERYHERVTLRRAELGDHHGRYDRSR